MKAVAQAKPAKEPTTFRSSDLDRLADLAGWLAREWEGLPPSHKDIWHQRAQLALGALNGVRKPAPDQQGQRRLVREAMQLCGFQGEPEPAPPAKPLEEREARRARQVAAYVADADADLGAQLHRLCDTHPDIIVQALRAYSTRPRRPKRGQAVVGRRKALGAVYARLGIPRDASLYGVRARLELPPLPLYRPE